MKVNPTTAGEGSHLSFSPDSRTLASAIHGISLWDMRTGHLQRRFGGASYQLWSLAYSSDGSTVAGGDYEGHVKLWDPRTGKLKKDLLYSATKKWVRTVAFSPDGSVVAGGGDDGDVGVYARPYILKLWNVRNGELIKTIDAHSSTIRAIKFSPTGKTLVSGGYDNTAKLWKVSSGKLLRTLPHKDGVSSLDFSTDGKTLATGCDDAKVRLWEIDNP